MVFLSVSTAPIYKILPKTLGLTRTNNDLGTQSTTRLGNKINAKKKKNQQSCNIIFKKQKTHILNDKATTPREGGNWVCIWLKISAVACQREIHWWRHPLLRPSWKFPRNGVFSFFSHHFLRHHMTLVMK